MNRPNKAKTKTPDGSTVLDAVDASRPGPASDGVAGTARPPSLVSDPLPSGDFYIDELRLNVPNNQGNFSVAIGGHFTTWGWLQGLIKSIRCRPGVVFIELENSFDKKPSGTAVVFVGNGELGGIKPKEEKQ